MGVQSNSHWSLNHFIFIGNSEKIMAKWSKLTPLFKITGSAPEYAGRSVNSLFSYVLTLA